MKALSGERWNYIKVETIKLFNLYLCIWIYIIIVDATFRFFF